MSIQMEQRERVVILETNAFRSEKRIKFTIPKQWLINELSRYNRTLEILKQRGQEEEVQGIYLKSQKLGIIVNEETIA